MAGLARVCKAYGAMTVRDKDGRSARWVYDYANDAPVLETEMPVGSDRWKASERAKWAPLRKRKQD